MTKSGITAEELMAGYNAYMEEWHATYHQLDRTPMWRFIRYHRLLNKLSQLTKNYTAKYLEENTNGNS